MSHLNLGNLAKQLAIFLAPGGFPGLLERL